MRRPVEALIRLTAMLEVATARRLRNEIIRAMRDTAKRMEADQSTAGIEAEVRLHGDNVGRILAAGHTSAAKLAGKRVQDLLGVAIAEDPFMVAVRAWTRTYAAEKVKDISQTTINQIRNVIASMPDEPIKRVAKRIREAAPSLAGYRAERIARTEIHSAASFGQQAMAEQIAGEAELELVKVWVSAEDDRTREDHADANGQSVGLNESFTVGGEELDYPGDPAGSPGNIINCRCAVVFESV